MANRKREFHQGFNFSTFTILGFVANSRYKVKCKCGYEALMTSCQIKKEPKCRKCDLNNLIGKKNNFLTFVDYVGDSRFFARCDCGKICVVRARSKSCGCHLRKNIEKKARKNIGKYIGNFFIVDYMGPNNEGDSNYKVKCPCKKIFESTLSRLRFIKSCGCRINAEMARGSRQGHSKINEKIAYQIKELFLTGLYTRKDLNEMFNVSLSIISSIISGKQWKHVKIQKKLIDESPVKSKVHRKLKRPEIEKVYGDWTVLVKSESKHQRAYYSCRCRCGNIRNVAASDLLTGKSTKCYDCNAKNFSNLNRKNN